MATSFQLIPREGFGHIDRRIQPPQRDSDKRLSAERFRKRQDADTRSSSTALSAGRTPREGEADRQRNLAPRESTVEPVGRPRIAP